MLPRSTTTTVLACLVVLGLAQHLENDMQSLLHDQDVNLGATPVGDDDDLEVEVMYLPEPEERSPSGGSSSTTSQGVRRLWGVADTDAKIGRLFSYPIPADAFQGDVLRYQVRSPPPPLLPPATPHHVFFFLRDIM